MIRRLRNIVDVKGKKDEDKGRALSDPRSGGLNLEGTEVGVNGDSAIGCV